MNGVCGSYKYLVIKDIGGFAHTTVLTHEIGNWWLVRKIQNLCVLRYIVDIKMIQHVLVRNS